MRVAIAEDSVLLREGMARLLGEAGLEVVAQCDNADDLLVEVRNDRVDVAIVDIRLPPTHNDAASFGPDHFDGVTEVTVAATSVMISLRR